ncbi:DUF1492 domain-containing protein [Streptococcus minor]|uniref:DUF1492 domain-containing protein n=1 Tax=Streptococcus minor TaxID=229549 RepID=UPI00036BAD30|nr:DUF1492 domain-containing protein [Streptococcus minor]
MARKELTSAEKLLNELRTIPKIINELKLDIERTEGSLLSSPQWSDMRVNGGVRKSQEDKNISIIDTSEYNRKEVERLLKRKEEILQLMNGLESEQRLLLITAYVNCEYPNDALDRLGWGKSKFYTVKRLAIKQLNGLIQQ